MTHFETPTNNIEILAQESKNLDFHLIDNSDPMFINETRIEGIEVTNPDPVIVIESQIESIKFERHKEESLINSQVL